MDALAGSLYLEYSLAMRPGSLPGIMVRVRIRVRVRVRVRIRVRVRVRVMAPFLGSW